VAYAVAAIPARYVLENKLWKDAAGVTYHNQSFPMDKFPWQKAILHFARLMGAAHTGDFTTARMELKNLHVIHDTLTAQKDAYKANQVLIQAKTGEAWILWEEGKPNAALQLMKAAAELEDKTEKSPVTPGEVIPAKELLGDMLLAAKKPAEALKAYEENLKQHPNRFNGLYGAGLAAEESGDNAKAKLYYQQLVTVANSPGSNRPELKVAKTYLSMKAQ
jgi:tetratricopeptide (TPR) repeat protein